MAYSVSIDEYIPTVGYVRYARVTFGMIYLDVLDYVEGIECRDGAELRRVSLLRVKHSFGVFIALCRLMKMSDRDRFLRLVVDSYYKRKPSPVFLAGLTYHYTVTYTRPGDPTSLIYRQSYARIGAGGRVVDTSRTREVYKEADSRMREKGMRQEALPVSEAMILAWAQYKLDEGEE